MLSLEREIRMPAEGKEEDRLDSNMEVRERQCLHGGSEHSESM